MESNTLIAEFMGCTHLVYTLKTSQYQISQGTFELDELKYHTSWDWLMPVIGKCYQEHNRDAYFIQHNKHLLESIKNCDIDKAHQIVVEFIKN